MTPEFGIKVLLILATTVALVFIIRRLQAPRPRTKHLAMTVWAAFGPYDTAEFAEDGLRWASAAVFGRDGISEHKNWIQGYIKDFHHWQASGSFQKIQKMLRWGLMLTAYGPTFEDACQRFRDQAMAAATEIMGRLNESLSKAGHKLEPSKQADGTYQVLYKKIWSDAEIKKKEQETGEAILNGIGNNLLEDKSDAAKILVAFLGKVYEDNFGRNIKTPKDIGIIWFACLEVIDKDPNSEVAQTFKVLNEAWNTSQSNRGTDQKEQTG